MWPATAPNPPCHVGTSYGLEQQRRGARSCPVAHAGSRPLRGPWRREHSIGLSVSSNLDGFAQVCWVLAVLEGIRTDQHEVQHHARAPHVRGLRGFASAVVQDPLATRNGGSLDHGAHAQVDLWLICMLEPRAAEL